MRALTQDHASHAHLRATVTFSTRTFCISRETKHRLGRVADFFVTEGKIAMWIASLVAAFRTWSRYRATVRQLSNLDNRMLKDIGIERAEIERAAWQATKA